MSFVDHESSFQVDFPRNIVFSCASEALKANQSFKIRKIDPIMHTIELSAGISLFSWGENISVNIKEKDSDKTEIIIASTPVTGAMFGGAMDMGKNRKNIEAVAKCISCALQNVTTASSEPPAASPAPPPPPEAIHSPAADDATSFVFVCPFCSTELECPVELENTVCKCPQCGEEICPARD